MSRLRGGRLIYLAAVTILLFLLNIGNSSSAGRFPSSSSSSSSSLSFLSSSSSSSSSLSFLSSNADISDELHTNNIPLWKQQLPFPLSNKTKTLQRIFVPGPRRVSSGRMDSDNDNDNSIDCGVEVILLGTAHVSTDSSRDVRQLLETTQPDAIFVELCYQRLPLLETTTTEDEVEYTDDTKQDEEKESQKVTGRFWQRWRNDNSSNKKMKKHIDTRSLSTIASSLMSNMQEEFAGSLDVELGSEFKQAYDYWKTVINSDIDQNQKCSNIELKRQQQVVHMILGDRPVSLTLTRAWESLPAWGKIKLLAGLVISSFRKPNPEELKEWMQKILQGDTDLMSESIAGLAKHFPTLETVIIKERDAYMACKLYQTCRSLLLSDNLDDTNRVGQGTNHRRYRLVAIVGAGHIEGICRWLTAEGSLSTTTMTQTSSTDVYKSEQHKEQPEDILSQLIQTKAPIPQEDQDYLVNEIT
eukprot:CAMPEP_0170867514 /NCGR_PEP_ID=MMETSP0734-20130129/22873_1 /TAXON_ID=186038 /ORGANISM="Fragilariopsis kerguelensis, Strain L26-C5" /LENGTH=470 /DNA_ID=CAMNT_0011244837 /DNA_START=20 /DNA_END=1430 /DNA_ORIENTATION=+